MSEHANMACPACRTALVMSERQGIEIDYCPACRGVWLDRGELDKIVERSAIPATAPATPASAPFAPRPDRHDERQQHGRRRKSFFEELFD